MEAYSLQQHTSTYRLKCCNLGSNENIVNIGQKERAAATQHFKDIMLEKLILEELTRAEHANEFKQIFNILSYPLILPTFIENTVVTEYIGNFIKSTYGISGNEYNVKFFGTSRSL